VWAIASYNRLIGMRNQVLNGWRQIDVQLKRRHDLIPNLVNAVRGSMDFERDTLTAVMDARAKALTATGPADAAQKEGQLSMALGRLLAVAENYPTLKSNDNVKMLQEELSATENKVGFARQFYNDIATKFNTSHGYSPTNIFASAWASSRRNCSRSLKQQNATSQPSICPDADQTQRTRGTRRVIHLVFLWPLCPLC
jgi:LemA protein